MSEGVGRTGLVFAEPLLWEQDRAGRPGFSLPRRDVAEASIDPTLVGALPDLPELSEPQVVRHYTRLSLWNVGVDTAFYPLGSCTMKYNPKVNDRLAALPGFADSHPLLAPRLAQGALELLWNLERHLAEITGMDAVSLQPAAGAQGELTGLLLIEAWHRSLGQRRTKILIPDTAHGTNPASAALCGYAPVPVASGDRGVLTAQAVAAHMDEDTAGIMVTNPNTLGLFEEEFRAIAEAVHAAGGQVYCDGANLNALLGAVRLGELGADVMHVNLHKTFSGPHGGGGPGAGPVCVRAHLEPFLPVPRVVRRDDGSFAWNEDRPGSIGRVHAFHGNFGVLVRAYAYLRTLGPEGLRRASQLAVLNANYLRVKLRDVLHLPFDRPCMHECVFTDQRQRAHKVTTLDLAKRLIDYGFHPPTVYFPLVVQGALMVEPTETESKDTLDAFVAALRAIAAEAAVNPELLRSAPSRTVVTRLDEVAAARQPCLTG
ncbi:MAG: aminomethyl-transferring glycine dehydrogenase subunit GcvPB [Proteobacteria bacterium]|nr:aminomethyl-transferring glycine dehydrogenase subunit GcvPB [Pseudomonadota bacterium]